MAKLPIIGWIHEPLAAALGTRAKVAVLRILWRASAPIPYREVVRRSAMAYGSIDLALGELTRIGLVEELAGGRERRVRLQSGHRLAASIGNLLQVEADFFASLRIELRTLAQGCAPVGLLTAAIVGAVTQRAEPLGSDVEVLIIARDATAANSCADRFDAGLETLRIRFGVGVKVIVYDLDTAQAMWRNRTPAAERTVREAEHLMGAPLEELLSALPELGHRAGHSTP